MDSVKSARVFEFLEYFERIRREVSVAEVARQHGHPISSIAAVMRAMVGLGYLSYNAAQRTYLPTARLPFLLDWDGNRLYDTDKVRAMMQDLSEATGETILLGAQNGIRAQFIDIVDATGPVRMSAATRLQIAAGNFVSLSHSALGLALLSRFDDAQLASLVRRINQQETDPARHVQVATLRDSLARVRRDGYALSLDGVVAGAGAIAMSLPHSVGATPLAIGIGSIDAVIHRNRDRFAAALRSAINRQVNPGCKAGL